MADRTQLRAADSNDISEDDPFAELTRIMGFDPRQPARPQTPVVEKAAPANQAAEEGDFDIDLEKELMGEFDAVGDYEPVAFEPVSTEPAMDATSVAATDDELAASLDHDFVFDDAEDHAHFAVARAPEPEADIAFDEDFDRAVSNSLDVSPLDDDLRIDQDMAASLDEDFRADHHEAYADHGGVEAAAASDETAFDADFDHAAQMALEDELASGMPERDSAATEREPVVAAAEQALPEDDFAGHIDEAMADLDMELDHQPHDLLAEPEMVAEDEQPQAIEAATEVEHFAADHRGAFDPEPAFEPEPVVDPEPVAEHEAAQVLDDDFEVSFRDALAEEPEAPAVEPVAVAEPSLAEVAPVVAAVPQVAAVEPPAAASERSLEDELNALLGAMTARPMPVVKEAAPAPQPVVQSTGDSHKAEESATDLDWGMDEHEPTEGLQAAHSVHDADLDASLASELDRQDAASAAAPANDEPSIDFDDDAFDAAFSKGLEQQDAGERSDPARSWSRVNPVAAPSQVSFAAQPVPQPEVAVPQMSASSYRDEPVEDHAASAYSAPRAAYSAPTAQVSHHDDVPDVETVDVPERVVALADDLDIPELNFEEDQPAAPAYDDLDAEFASLLTEMNSTEVAPVPAQSRTYDDDSYNSGFKADNSGFKAGYDRHELRAETPAAPAVASHAAATGDFNANDLPGSRPVSQADDLAADELDYDPELDEAMTVPGLAERAAAKPRGRGMMVAALVGAVVVAGGLGALAFSFGGKGGSEAPVIVKADNSPIKVKPQNPGGTVVPNQDNKVYDAVVKGGTAKTDEPVQEKLVTNTEEPVDVASKEPPQSRVVDLSPNKADAAADAASNADSALPGVDPTAAGADAEAPGPDAAAPASAQAATSENVQPATPESAQPAAPAPKSEDRIAQVVQQDAENAGNTDVVAVAPRKVRTMMVKPDGSLVPREDLAPAAPKVAAAEPADPAPQHVAPADGQSTGTVTTDQAADQADADQGDATKPAAAIKPAAAPKAEAKAQSTNTPAKVPVAPPRPSDQPVDIVGEVKPDQVASIDPATASAGGGSWSMQIASQPTVESAQSTYQDLQRRYGSVLAGRSANIVKAEIAGKGTFYRVRVPAQSRNDAINLCTSYKAAGGNCFVSR